MEIFTTLTLELRDGIAIVTLNDAPRRNALSRCMVGELFAAIDQSRALGARALVIAANGPTFCAGANIDDLRDGWMERADPARIPRYCSAGSWKMTASSSQRCRGLRWAAASS